jgi:hypothetical protein
MDIQEETLGKTRRHQWNKEPRLKTAITSGKQNTQQDFQEYRRAGDRELNSWVFCQNVENKYQDIMEGPAPSETENETAHRLKSMDVGALTTLGTFAPTD